MLDGLKMLQTTLFNVTPETHTPDSTFIFSETDECLSAALCGKFSEKCEH